MPAPRHWNPEGIAAPASRYSHAALVEGPARWLHLSGQVGIAPDGSTPEGLTAQLDQSLANIDAGLASAGMTRANLVKLTWYLTSATPEAIATYRARRDAWLGDVTPASTLLIVAGLASPAWVVEVDAVAAG
jgi:2-iminobutanoate/2-iminopropanoate deaminase